MEIFDVQASYHSEIWLVVGQRSALARRRTLDFADLVEERWMLPRLTRRRWLWRLSVHVAAGVADRYVDVFRFTCATILGRAGSYCCGPSLVLQLNAHIGHVEAERLGRI